MPKKNWQVEPVKLSSLMVNTHPEYNGWGLEVGRRLADHLWVTSMIEKTKGGDFIDNFDPNYDFLMTFDYLAVLGVVRYYVKPEGAYTSFFDGGLEFQRATHKFLRNNVVYREEATAVGPLVMFGGERRLSETVYFKWRFGAILNLYRAGSMKSRIDDGQDQPSFYLYPHLSDAVIKRAIYAGDVAFGIKI